MMNTNITTDSQLKKGIVIRFEKASSQEVGNITKITGLVRAKYFVEIIDNLDMDANPRKPKTGPVTDAILDTIGTDPSMLPFKTKGVLLGGSDYDLLDRGRVRIFFEDPSVEGILDGGHNTLAIGLLILKRAMAMKGLKMPRRAFAWDQFKELWREHSDLVGEYLVNIRKPEDVDAADLQQGEDLSFYMPVELLVPSDPKDKVCVDDFRRHLADICAARNNNVELKASTKANQQGYFDDLHKLLEQANPEVAERVSWKTNDGGVIDVKDIVTLSWIVLRTLPPVADENGRKVEAPAPSMLYSGKAGVFSTFERFMSSPEVTTKDSNGYRHGLRNIQVHKAFELAVQIPELYDMIYEQLPDLYNRAGGSYGRITAVKGENAKAAGKKVAPFSGKPVETASPKAYIMPLVYGLTALVDPEKVEWRTDPKEFLGRWLPAIVAKYSQVFPTVDYDPQKIGKAASSYSTAEDAYKMAIAGIL